MNESSQELIDLALARTRGAVTRLARELTARGLHMCTAESCTGGLIAGACTHEAGSSDWFDCGFVTYSNSAKTHMLGVDAVLIELHGAVSQPVASAMALGAIERSGVGVSVAVTGVAGPSGGSAQKPVGTVWFGWCVGHHCMTEMQQFAGDRMAVRSQTVAHALWRLGNEIAALAQE